MSDMEQWQQEFWETVQTVAEEVENFFWDVVEVTDNFIEFTEDFVEKFQNIDFENEEQYINDFTETFLPNEWEFDEFSADDLESILPYRVEATEEKNPACIACTHYHGQVYDGNLLVCGMHPYGWSDRNCPDWEKKESDNYF